MCYTVSPDNLEENLLNTLHLQEEPVKDHSNFDCCKTPDDHCMCNHAVSQLHLVIFMTCLLGPPKQQLLLQLQHMHGQLPSDTVYHWW